MNMAAEADAEGWKKQGFEIEFTANNKGTKPKAGTMISCGIK